MINKDYLENLNDAQKEAVLHLDGPLLIVAGAGSGKTKVLTSRIANIIKEKKAFPNQILAVTFTNKAAKEMQNRVSKILGSTAVGRVVSYDQTTGVLKYWQDKSLVGFNSDGSLRTDPKYGYSLHGFTVLPSFFIVSTKPGITILYFSFIRCPRKEPFCIFDI